mgnify:FL=1
MNKKLMKNQFSMNYTSYLQSNLVQKKISNLRLHEIKKNKVIDIV